MAEVSCELIQNTKDAPKQTHGLLGLDVHKEKISRLKA